MIKKIAFLDPGSVQQVVEQGNGSAPALDQIGIGLRSHEPIGLCYVAGWAHQQGFEVSIISPRTNAVSIEQILENGPEMVCFSALTFNYGIARDAARNIKRLNRKIYTVIGGYHATCLPDEVGAETAEDGQPLFDFVVTQEADFTAADLAEFLNDRRSKNQIRGIVYSKGKHLVNNFQRIDPNCNPIPYRTIELMVGRRRFGLYDPAPSQQRQMALMVSSRGCPFHCTFCISKKIFPPQNGECVLYRDPQNVIREVEVLQEQHKTNYVFFVDLDFHGLDKGRIGILCKLLAKTGIKWYAMSRVTAGSVDGTTFDMEIFELMKLGGCTEIGFGVESLIHRKKSGVRLEIPAWQELVKKLTDGLRRLGIISKGYFILGDFGDTLDDIAAEETAIIESGFDELRLSWMIYSPGTPQYRFIKEKEGFVTDDFSFFSTDYPIIRIPGAGPERLQQIRLDVYRKFYARPEYQERAAETIRKNPHLARPYQEWNEILVRSLGQGFSP